MWTIAEAIDCLKKEENSIAFHIFLKLCQYQLRLGKKVKTAFQCSNLFYRVLADKGQQR